MSSWLLFSAPVFVVPLAMGLGFGAFNYVSFRWGGCQRCVQADYQVNQLEQAYYSAMNQPVQTSWLDQYFELIVLFEISVVLLLLVCTLLVLIKFLSALEKKALVNHPISEKSDNA